MEVTTYLVDLSLSTRGLYSENELSFIRINQFIPTRKVLYMIKLKNKGIISQIWFNIDKCKQLHLFIGKQKRSDLVKLDLDENLREHDRVISLARVTIVFEISGKTPGYCIWK